MSTILSDEFLSDKVFQKVHNAHFLTADIKIFTAIVVVSLQYGGKSFKARHFSTQKWGGRLSRTMYIFDKKTVFSILAHFKDFIFVNT